MSNTALAALLIFLITTFIALFLFNIIRKFVMVARTKYIKNNKEIIRQKIDAIIDKPELEFKNGMEEFSLDAAKKGRSYINVINEYLMETLESPDVKNREKLIEIARHLDFPNECLAQIRSRIPRISAMGSRRAGIYRFTEFLKDMIIALDTLSIENQLEILMGLSRIGNAAAMQQAFEKIKNSILVNERAVIQILFSFPNGNEKEKLFRHMLYCDSNYVVSLFLKAMDKEMTKELLDDIIKVLKDGSKEIRISTLRCLGTLGSEAPEKYLINALLDNNWEVRAQAAKALEYIWTADSSYSLFQALHDRHWWVRQNAANSMIKHPGYETFFTLTAESEDKFSIDSVINALENEGNVILLRNIKKMAVRS